MKRLGRALIAMAAFALLFDMYGWPIEAQEKSLSREEVSFMKDTASGSMMEIRLAEIAAKQATSSEVKDFASQMANDHSKMSQQLMQLAQRKGVDIPKTMNPEHKQMVDQLSKMEGAEFDREYMRHMLEDHIEDIHSFKKASEHAQDPDVKSFASNQIQTLERHLKMAKDVHRDVERGAKT